MRFSTSSALLALPLLASAQGEQFEQYKAQFQNFLGQFGSYVPNPSKHDPVGAAEAKLGEMKLNVLTLDNWKDTLYEPVKPESTKPEEWWVLISGGNKTCFGHCLKVEEAFNQTAAKLAVLPDAPHVGFVNCDDQPILCNAWSAGAGSVWLFEMLPPPAPVDIYIKRMNLSTTDSDTFLELYKTREDKSQFHKKDGYFHPFNGELAQYGLAVPLAYALWGLSVVPSWAMMLIVSFVSRTFMSRRMAPPPGAPSAGGAAPRR
ncbi:hypothetical protein KVR01_006331 [Diaporthe batatas]|uniref:uncharacterized protein n=1 Tax=Diaporthe batatas TaxID=748121 RepID=UPI001D057B10|nr:uncharacterized protein KVR01_006331 [Diaporthe batatas]KAG8164413.1 hypothetical protein KVR01_006331 [Diaporthe batatas]